MTGSEPLLDKNDVEVSGRGGAPLPMRTLFFDHNSDREVHIIVSPDRLRAYMKLAPGAHFAGITLDAVSTLIQKAGVAYGRIETGIRLFTAMQNGPSPFSGYFQIARGDPMQRGEDGSIEFHVHPVSLQPRYDKDDSGGIDYRQSNLIESCFSGQRIASILPPGPGRAGRDVFGEELPAEPGTPVAVQAGAGVIVSANGRDFTADAEGRVLYENGILSVSRILEIVGDIDYGIGNVDFVGKVVVKGSLLDGFYVNGKLGVEIHGDMGAARIASEGDVLVTGGVKGKNAAIITCRNLTIHYIDDATVEATGNIEAAKEILNSDVRALGRISITKGAVVGGRVCAFRGVETGVLGSDMGVATSILAGLNWTEENRKEELRGRIAEYQERLQSAKTILDPLLANPGMKTLLDGEQKSMLSELISELRDIRDNLAELLRDRNSLLSRQQDGMICQVNVGKSLNMGVEVTFTAATGIIKDAVKGPLSITQDNAAKTIRVGSFSRLPALAAEADGEPRKNGTQ